MTIRSSHRSASVLGVLALGGVAVLAGCSGAPEASASASAEEAAITLTFTLDGPDGDYDQVDTGKKGETMGDHHLAAMTLKSDGEIAGRMIVDCTVADPTYEGQTCSGLLLVDGGTMAFETGGLHKPIPGVDFGEEAYAVTGGTGEYAGASGEMTIGQTDLAPVKITLSP